MKTPETQCIIGLVVDDNVVMKDFDLTTKEITELKRLHRMLSHRKDADKVKAVILLGTGWSAMQVAEILLLDEKTLRRYVQRYQENPEGDFWLTTFHQGSQAKLSEDQITLLDQHLEETVYLTVAEIAEYVKKEFGIQYSINGLTNLLHRMDYTYKKPKRVPGKADALAQQEFVEEYEKLKDSKQTHDPIYFVDGVHPQHNSVPAFGWIKKGQTRTIKSNTGRARLNINGAVNAETLEVVARHDETINAQSTIQLFKMVEKKHRKADIIYVIADNARYYRNCAVKEYLEFSRIKLIFLPPYSPNLNLIERLWKYFRKKILYNKYYETFSEFKEHAMAFFANIKQHKAALRTLLADNFEIISI